MTYINSDKFSHAVRVIYQNIDQPLTLDFIASQTGVSIASLKRLFKEAISQSPGTFIRRLRMELSFRSLQSRQDSILETALAAGFDDQAAFARTFKKAFGYTPTQARTQMNIVNELESITLTEPDVVELATFNLQVITETGLYFEAAPHAWEKLKQQLTDNELSDDFTGVFIGIGHDNPHAGEVADDQVRFSAGVASLDRILTNATIFKITAGSYARFHYDGKPNNLGLAYHYIYGKWPQQSGFKINDEKPAFIIFECLPDSLQQQSMIIHVPLL